MSDQPCDQIIIKGLRLKTRIGVPKEERATPQELRAHLTMNVPSFPEEDTISGTVDYKEVSDQIVGLAASVERQLIETLAQDIAAHILAHFRVRKIRVELEKFILPETDWVGVVIERGN
ncbi:dihydroneopterin aldolase [Akkermansiaceae bacterium]|nr:dihydroneopterin aldolase [Akkermansiaceae bacterium]